MEEHICGHHELDLVDGGTGTNVGRGTLKEALIHEGRWRPCQRSTRRDKYLLLDRRCDYHWSCTSNETLADERAIHRAIS
jgi:hypothetical protein